ncbi:MAG: YedE-related selenium metabolism membrane protein [Dethiobacter sp.]|nr:YedE-related selenium metabolism membrane protein [Dethiobacter sp.]
MERRLIVCSGVFLGLLGVVLVKFGNPANMGVCVACFYRDIAGGLGLHRTAAVQYLRPEISGFILGSFLISLFTGEFRARGGSSPMLRFLLGFTVMIGALVFLGCPLRMLLRLSAGDLNALVGLFGFIAGIFAGVFFLRRGFSLGRSVNLVRANGLSIPAVAIILVLLAVVAPAFIFFSESGPGSFRAPFAVSLAAGLLIGIVVQRSRLCQAGCFRDLFLLKDPHLLYGSLAIFITALIFNLGFGYFRLGFSSQPVAHTDGIWNFLGLALVGLGSTLLGGCPLRQTVMAGEGDADAGMSFLGMLVGAAFAHNFGLASSAAGATPNGKWGVVLGFMFLLSIGFTAVLPKIKVPLKGEVSYDV